MNIEIINGKRVDSDGEDSLEEFLRREERDWFENRTEEAEKTGLSAEAAQRMKELHAEAMKGE